MHPPTHAANFYASAHPQQCLCTPSDTALTHLGTDCHCVCVLERGWTAVGTAPTTGQQRRAPGVEEQRKRRLVGVHDLADAVARMRGLLLAPIRLHAAQCPRKVFTGRGGRCSRCRRLRATHQRNLHVRHVGVPARHTGRRTRLAVDRPATYGSQIT